MGRSLLQQVAAGDPTAMQHCIAEYGGVVWGIARRLTRTSADAEDATQEVFLQIWKHASRFDPELGSEAGFIATIARHRIIDKWRRGKTQPILESLGAHAIDVAWAPAKESAQADYSLDADIAAQAMAALRPEYRAVLELGFVHGLTHSEIARRLNIPLGTVKSNMRRGLLQVRDALNGVDFADDGERGDSTTPGVFEIRFGRVAPAPV